MNQRATVLKRLRALPYNERQRVLYQTLAQCADQTVLDAATDLAELLRHGKQSVGKAVALEILAKIGWLVADEDRR